MKKESLLCQSGGLIYIIIQIMYGTTFVIRLVIFLILSKALVEVVRSYKTIKV